jgi:hypothetical protein
MRVLSLDLSVPKIRFCNNGDEIRSGRAQFAALLEEIVGPQHHRSFSVDWPLEEPTRCLLLNRIAQPQKLIYSMICLHLMLAFKIVHRRGADRTPHCLALIKHREINDHPIEVVAQYFASLQRHCKSSVLKRSDYAISAGLAQPAIAASKISEFFEVTQHPTAEWLARQITIRSGFSSAIIKVVPGKICDIVDVLEARERSRTD